MDINHDGYDEVVFSLFSGYSFYPRNIFAYNIKEDTMLRSPLSANGFAVNINFNDLNNDGVDEVYGFIFAPENIHYPMPYSDSAAWLMIINPATMDFLFPPKRFDNDIGGLVNPTVLKTNHNTFIGVVSCSKSAKMESNTFDLILYDSVGNVVNKRALDHSQYNYLYFIESKSPNQDFLFD